MGTATVRILAAAVACVACFALPSAGAEDKVKIGFISTLSGPSSALGIDIRDAFNLEIEMHGGKIGGLPAEVIVTDDQFNPDVGKQAAERDIKRDKVDFMTGVVFSNILLPLLPQVLESKTIYVSANAAPSSLAGADCNPYFFVASWPNDAYHEAAGKWATDQGFKSVFLIAPNYQAGRDSMAGFKRTFKGTIADEVYTKLGQLDYATEIAQVRAAKPDALYIFLPGGMGINFIKQFVASGLSKDVRLIAPGFAADDDIIRAVGAPMAGLFNTAHWAPDFDNEANRKFVAAFRAKYHRMPTVYAAQGYDAAQLIDSAVAAVKGNLSNKEALRAAMKAAKFSSVRGEFKFNRNQFPIQNYYLRVIGRDADGNLVNKTIATILTNHGDAYVQECKMK